MRVENVFEKVSRVEVINHARDKGILGRVYVKWDIPKVELSLQDEGRTLKIFLSEADDES